MSAPVILVEVSPRRTADGVAETVRLAGAGAVRPYRYPDAAGGPDQSWRAGIVSLPTIICSLSFDGTDLGTGGVPQATEILWAPARSSDLEPLAAYFWFDAAIKVRIGPEDASPPVVIAGKVLGASIAEGKLKLSLADPAASLKKPVPLARYAGTGDLEGPTEWAGKLKDRIWGRVWNKPGEPIDKANNIYAFADPTRPLQAIDAVRDKGAAAAALTTVAWQGSVATTLAALRAAAAPEGGGVGCPSIACVKWWTQPAGALCADLMGEIGAGYVETTAGIASALVSAVGGPVFAAGTVAAAATARPAAVGWVVDDDSTTVATMLDQLLGNSSLLWLLSSAGEIVIRQWAWGASVAAAKSHQVTRLEQLRPVHTRKIGYQRNELPMARGEIASILLARLGTGEWSNVRTYYRDEGVTYLGRSFGSKVDGNLNRVPPATATSDANWYLVADKGADGTSNYQFRLNNDDMTFPADKDGNVTSYANGYFTCQVFHGSIDVTSSFGFTTPANPQSLSIVGTAPSFQINGGLDATEDSATVTIRATGSGPHASAPPLDQTITVSKSKAGQDGSPAPLVTLDSTTNSAPYDKNNAYLGGVIDFSATRVNIPTGTNYIFAIYRVSDGLLLVGPDTAAGFAAFQPANYSSAAAGTLTISAAGVASLIAANGAFRVVASAPGYTVTDSQSVTKIKDGADGAQGATGAAGAAGAQGPAGVDGQTLYTWIAYANSADGTVGFTTGANTGQTYIGIANNKTTATESITPADYTWSLIKGTDGVPGSPGADGVTTYTWIAYSTAADGSANFTTGAPTPGLHTYLGIAANKTTAIESLNPADYFWSLIKGADGAVGATGAPGVSPVTVRANPSSMVLKLDAAGAVKIGQLPLIFGISATKGGAGIAVTSITITSSSGGTWDVLGSTVRLTAMTGGATSGECTFTVVAGGETLAGNTVGFSTSQDGSTVNQVSKVWTPTNTELAGASFAQSGTNVAFNARAAGTLSVNLTGFVKPGAGHNAVAQYAFISKVQISTNGGSTWTDVTGSQVNSTVSENVAGGEPGAPPQWTNANVNGTGPYALTGLGANAAVLIRAMTMIQAPYSGFPADLTGSFTIFADAN